MSNIHFDNIDPRNEIERVPNPTDKDELREKLCKIFDVFPEELQYNLPGGIGLRRIEQLEALIDRYADQRVKEARIDENTACQNIIRSKWGTNDQLWEMQARLATLKESKDE